MKKSILAITVLAAIGVGAANAALVSYDGNFTMYGDAGLDNAGVMPGGSYITSEIAIFGFVDQAVGTWSAFSTSPYLGLHWTASGGTLYTAPGSYALDTTSGAVTPAPATTNTADGIIHFTVGSGQIAGTINLAWGASSDIRVVNVWNVNGDGSLTAALVPGMENGPFSAYTTGINPFSTINATFNLTSPGRISTVPVPAAFWLFGSGLIGLIGAARRKKARKN